MMANIPMMFRAQIERRGKIQYAGDARPASQWVDEWLKGCPPTPPPADSSVPVWQRRQTAQSGVKMPRFGRQVKTRDYQIRWRLVTNSGQDEGVIRPVIGAKGLPFFPGSSMKGAFLRACPPEDRENYCGGEVMEDGEKRTKPGILRFHGGYPVDMKWGSDRDRLVDVVHGQQPYQVMRGDAGHTANVQISLYRPEFRFGISSSVIPDGDPEWDRIWKIWEKALGKGIGSRVSAGYGYVEEVDAETPSLFSVHLKGQGLTSQLLTQKPEFRPNLFKATLRGHTLRLLGGLTEREDVARNLTQKLWGGIDGGATVGAIGINFKAEDLELFPGPKGSSLYELESGRLDLLQLGNVSPKANAFLQELVRFSLLMGGFGKSWRRVDHELFYPDYKKFAIGCHWELLLPKSKNLCVINNKSNLQAVTAFLDKLRSKATTWMESEGYQSDGYIDNWREAWHPDKVQVWGRLAKDKSDSLAVRWFHDTQKLKNSALGGSIGTIGRSWHRMYPRYVYPKDQELRRNQDQYVELLTLFPDDSNQTQQFLGYLQNQSDPSQPGTFRQLWGGNN